MWSTLPKTNSEFTLKNVGTWHFLLAPDLFSFLRRKIAKTYNQPILSTPTSPTPPKQKKTPTQQHPDSPNLSRWALKDGPRFTVWVDFWVMASLPKSLKQRPSGLVHERFLSEVGERSWGDKGVSWNGGTPKWMVKIMENPIKMDDLGGKPTIFGNIYKLAVGRPSKWTTYFLWYFFCLGWMVIVATKATTIAVFLEGTCQKTAVNKKMVGMARP